MTTQTTTQTTDLYRAIYPGLELRQAADGSQPTMFGHFAVFNQWTEINSIFEGRFLERFAPGAFQKTIQENRSRMRVIFDHGFDPSVGDKVMGSIEELKEDREGAFYSVPLLDTSYNRDLIPGLEAGLYGASFRFQVVKEEWNDMPPKSAHNPERLPERTVLEARVMEFGPTPFPAYEGATAGTRSATDRYLRNIRTLETGAAAGTPDPGAAPPAEEPPEHSNGLTAAARERELKLLVMEVAQNASES